MKRKELFKIVFDAICKPVPYNDDGAAQMMWMTINVLEALDKKGIIPEITKEERDEGMIELDKQGFSTDDGTKFNE